MQDPIIRLTGKHADELVPFLDRAFDFERGKSFRTFLPALYDPRDLLGQYTLALRQDGHIAAAVGVFPFQWQIGAATLRIGGIGHVSCEPKLRGQGHMSRLLGAALADLRGGGYDLTWLGGHRQRYLHYGWEIAGCCPRLAVGQGNVRHHFASAPPPSLRIKLLEDDPGLEAGVRALHDTQPVRCQRPGATFALILRHWRHQPIVALDQAGQVAAYAVTADEGNRIVELVGRDTGAAVDLVRQYLADPERHEVRLCISPFDGDLVRSLADFAGAMGIEQGGNWQVLNWPATLDALLKARLTMGPMAQGQVTLAIEGVTRTIRLSIDGRMASAQHCDDPPDLKVDAALATRVLFGPLAPWQVMQLPPQADLLNAWCPLPLYLPEQDHV